MENNHIVYAAFDTDGICLYVGEGKEDRWQHIVSGTSHVYEANKWHFLGRKVEVKILANSLLKQDAERIEKDKILELRPAWNKAEYGSIIPMNMALFATKRFKEICKTIGGRWSANQDRDIRLVKDLCKVLNNNGETTLAKGQKWYSVEVPHGFMSHLATDGDKYYKAFKEVFKVTKIPNSVGCYYVELIGWKEFCKEKAR